MSANRANIDWHLLNMLGSQLDVPFWGQSGYAVGAVAVKTKGTIGLGMYYNYGTKDACDFRTPTGMTPILKDRVEQDTHEISTIQNYDLGARWEDPISQRVWRYCLSRGQCDTFIGNIFDVSIGTGAGDSGIDWSVIPVTAPVGATSIVMTVPSSRNVAVNALRGGLLSINPSVSTNNNLIQHRHVLSNTAGTASGTCIITFKKPLIRAATAATAYAFLMASPYGGVQGAQIGEANGKASFVGYAAAEVAVAGIYHWEQTAGPISASLYGNQAGETQYGRDVVFRFDGNLIHRAAAGITGLEAHRAGYIMDQNAADNGATMIMLQLDK